MTRETFLLVFVLGAATLALWIVLCLPGVTPRSLRAATVHIVAALLLGFFLGPALHLVPGQPATLSVLAALFGIALPALTYMLLTGFWFLKLMAGHPLARGR
jgi:peptidoglycan/LPS O-acetylase OafA/YrhL